MAQSNSLQRHWKLTALAGLFMVAQGARGFTHINLPVPARIMTFMSAYIACLFGVWASDRQFGRSGRIAFALISASYVLGATWFLEPRVIPRLPIAALQTLGAIVLLVEAARGWRRVDRAS